MALQHLPVVDVFFGVQQLFFLKMCGTYTANHLKKFMRYRLP